METTKETMLTYDPIMGAKYEPPEFDEDLKFKLKEEKYRAKNYKSPLIVKPLLQKIVVRVKKFKQKVR
jgi:hypothetical protein